MKKQSKSSLPGDLPKGVPGIQKIPRAASVMKFIFNIFVGIARITFEFFCFHNFLSQIISN